MKFLTIGSYKDSYNSLPQQEQLKLRIGDLEYWIGLKTKMGNKISYFAVPGTDLGVSMGDYESLEEFAQSQQYPTAQRGLVNGESYPLIEGDLTTLKAMLKRIKAAK